MVFRPPGPRPGLPATHYFVSISRGKTIRTVMLAPAALWAIVALAPLSLGFGVAGALSLIAADPPSGALMLRAADPSEADEAQRQRDARAAALEARVRDLVARQIRLEKRAAVVVSLATASSRTASAPAAAGGTPADALDAIESLARGAAAPAEPGGPGAARAYAPSDALPLSA
ncbi:MAG TPA: hypothetical protein VEH77_18375, partial [Roseiarcus sp.]|nr:hypothetical protein [Roseiarcus sp.]